MTPEHEVRAALAERYADLVDRAAKGQDAAALMRAGGQLLDLLDTLPVRTSEGGGEGVGPDDRGRLLRIIDGPPQVGNGSHS